MTLQAIDPKTVRLVTGEFVKFSEFGDLISDFDGTFTETNQWMDFDVNGQNYVVTFDMTVDGYIYEESDVNYSTFEVSNLDINITNIEVNEDSINMTSDLLKIFTQAIKNSI